MSEADKPESEETPAEVEAQPETPPGAEHKNGWSGEITMNVSMAIAGPPPVWVVKVDSRYVRLPTLGGFLTVADKRFATRFDSPLWAATIANGARGAKVVRLWTKAEREIDKARREPPRRFVYGPGGTESESKKDGPPPSEPSEGAPAAQPATTASP